MTGDPGSMVRWCSVVAAMLACACESPRPAVQTQTTEQLSTAQLAALGPPFHQCPAAGLDSGCAILLVISENGSLRVLSDPLQNPFDGIEDTLVGVVNLSSFPVRGIPLKGTQAIFDFDGDGLCSFIPMPPGTCVTGYEGPGVTFTVTSPTEGTVNFTNDLQPDEHRYFSLEEAVQVACPDVAVTRIRQFDAPWGCHVYANHDDDTTCTGGAKNGQGCSIDADCGAGAQCCVAEGVCQGGTNKGGTCASHTDCPGGKCKKNTIGALGCALTSSTMIINTAGGHTGAGAALTPQDLNDWLIDNDGYDLANDVKWYKIPEAAKNFGATLSYADAPTDDAGNSTRDDFTLDQYLCGGSPPVLAQPGHFVVATGQRSTPNCEVNYAIADPGYDRSDLDNKAYNCDYSSLRLFQRGGQPLAQLYFRVHSPVEIVVTDPAGRATGLDPHAGQRRHEIPRSTYYREQLANDEDPALDGEPEVKVLEVHQATDGRYRLHALGTADGPFTIEIDGVSREGVTVTSVVTGTASASSDAGYSIDYANGAIVVTPDNRPPDCTNAAPTVASLWPPDHSLMPVAIQGITDADGDPVGVTITSISQDEPLDAPGSGNTCPDAAGVGTATAQLRAERTGNGDGRVYHIGFVARDGRGGECQSQVTVCVPHDQGHGASCGDQGGSFDATGPCATH